MITSAIESESTSIVYEWPSQGKWTYDHYARLPDNGMHYEVIDGDLYMSLPAGLLHQSVVIELVSALLPFVKGYNLGQIYTAPLDVILRHRATPVQPDVVFVSKEHQNIVKEAYIEGAPDLVIEVLSPRSVYHDLRTKVELYAWAGVREYWLCHPELCAADVYTLRGNAFVPFGHFTRDGVIQPELLPDLRIQLADICPAV
jgi:Uma2 family endonuclease